MSQPLVNPDTAWRLLPHTLAHRCSGGKWIQFDYLVYCARIITEEIAKGNARLIFTMPPRHGKSTFISQWVPVWFFENYANKNVIITSYGADYAASWGRKVRDTLINNQDLECSIRHDVASSKEFETTKGGVLYTAGTDGPLTGRGAHLCFEETTLILTQTGYKKIRDIQVGEWVWSFNHETNKQELAPVEKIQCRTVSQTISVETASGGRIICTPNHHFWNEDIKKYRPASSLIRGDRLIQARIHEIEKGSFHSGMHLLPDRNKTIEGRLSKVIEGESRNGFLLQQSMQPSAPFHQEPTTVCHLQRKSFQENPKILRQMLSEVSVTNTKTQIQIGFCGYPAIDFHQGQFQMCRMWEGSGLQTNRSPHRLQSQEQHSRESHHTLPRMPFEASPCDSISIKKISENSSQPVKVYDMQVGRNNNYFAEGILVHNCIIDDPVKNFEDAMSEIKRQSAKNWFDSVLDTRLEPNGSVILLMTRWHEDDLAGYLINERNENYRVINLPALAEPKDLLGRKVGEALCPTRYNKKVLEARKERSPRVFQSLYQGGPTPAEGSILRRSLWKYYKKAPDKFDIVIQSWDMTFKDKSQSKRGKVDWVVGSVWGRIGSDIYLLDMVRGQWGFGKTCFQLLRLSDLWPIAFKKLVEDKANGAAVEDRLKRIVRGIRLVDPKGGKETRAAAAEIVLEGGHVWLPEPQTRPWVEEFVSECASFPNGKHDDRVDSATQAIIFLDKSSGGSSRLQDLIQM